MATPPENFRVQLTELRQEYIRQLPEKLGEIESGWAELRHSGRNLDRLRMLHRRTHSLVGSGATFGFPRLSDTARSLERDLKKMMEQSEGIVPDIDTEIENQLMEMRQAVIQANRELPVKTPDPESLGAKPVPSPEQPRWVYLVEDDEITARDMALQLKHFGYEVRVFETLKALREVIKSSPPDAIVMEMLMPDGDGLSALEEISREAARNIPTLVVTDLTDFESRLRAVRAGADGYLLKPVDIGGLVDKLDRLTGTREVEPYRVLIVEDSPILADYYALMLRQAGILSRVCTDATQVMTVLEEFHPDLILTDIYMTGCDGFELAAVLRQQDAFMTVPIVFLSTETDRDSQLLVLGTGADDFLTKPFAPRHLVAAVRSRALRARQLREQMWRDSLTGLLNHSTVKDRLDKELAQAARQGVPVALAMIDIDNFKSINDRHGYLAGDCVIKGLARLLQQRLRQSDVIGRYGGEEFIILLYDSNGPRAQVILDKMREDFAGLRHQADGEFIRATFSGGIVAMEGTITASELTEIADCALYQAKRMGRNRVILASY